MVESRVAARATTWHRRRKIERNVTRMETDIDMAIDIQVRSAATKLSVVGGVEASSVMVVEWQSDAQFFGRP